MDSAVLPGNNITIIQSFSCFYVYLLEFVVDCTFPAPCAVSARYVGTHPFTITRKYFTITLIS